MRKSLIVTLGIVGLCAIGTVVFAQRQQTNTALVRQRYLPEYTKDGDLVLPKNWRTWVYVGSPLTLDVLNNGKANVPEYHNVYIEPGSYDIYKKTGRFRTARSSSRNCSGSSGPSSFPTNRCSSRPAGAISPAP